MKARIQGKVRLFAFLLLGFLALLPPWAGAGTTPTMIIEEAKVAIEQARTAGADKTAPDDFQAARSWLAQAEKEYEGRKSLFVRLGGSVQAKEEEIIYLGTMAKLKALTAEAKARKLAAAAALKDGRKELADYQSALQVLSQKMTEVQKAREAQAKTEEERRALEETRRKAVQLEEQKKRELEEAQKRSAELEAQKQKEIQATRLEEATRMAQKERELAEARLRAEQQASQQAREAAELKAREEKMAAERAKMAAELKAREEKMAAERERMAALQKKAEALEREKTMLAEAARIPQASARAGDKEVVITILAINLFTPATEISPGGREILEQVGGFLKKHGEGKVAVRGHTDSTGSESINRTVSEKRADKVREYLVTYQNVDPAQISALGLGPSRPAATNATEAGRALNRRVEIAVQTGE